MGIHVILFDLKIVSKEFVFHCLTGFDSLFFSCLDVVLNRPREEGEVLPSVSKGTQSVWGGLSDGVLIGLCPLFTECG